MKLELINSLIVIYFLNMRIDKQDGMKKMSAN